MSNRNRVVFTEGADDAEEEIQDTELSQRAPNTGVQNRALKSKNSQHNTTGVNLLQTHPDESENASPRSDKKPDEFDLLESDQGSPRRR